MLSGAPPMLVVGLALQALWVPIAILIELTSSMTLGFRATTISFVLFFVGNIMVTAGVVELARRSRGRARDGMALAVLSDVLTLGLIVGSVALEMGMKSWGGREWMFSIAAWTGPITGLTGVLGFSIAVGLRHVPSSLTAFAITAVVFPIPPVSKVLYAHIPMTSDWLFVAYGALMIVRSLAVARLGAAVGTAAYPVVRDHVRAARGLWWVVAAAALRALGAAAVMVFVLADGDGDSQTAMAVTALELIAAVVLVKACWAFAQAQVASLPRYLGHVALAFALATVVAMLYALKDSYAVAVWQTELMNVQIPRWIELGGTVTIAWLIVVLGRYARRARPIAKRTAVCGAAFTLVSCVGVMFHGTPAVAAALAIVANLAVLPLFPLAAREVANDPVKTTADVFA